jgi:hypothetical protein
MGLATIRTDTQTTDTPEKHTTRLGGIPLTNRTGMLTATYQRLLHLGLRNTMTFGMKDWQLWDLSTRTIWWAKKTLPRGQVEHITNSPPSLQWLQ